MNIINRSVSRDYLRNGKLNIKGRSGSYLGVSSYGSISGNYLPATFNADGTYTVDLSKVTFTGNIIAEGEVTAYGSGDSGGSSGNVAIYDGLDSTASDVALSANQGRILKSLIDNIDVGDIDLSGYYNKSEIDNTLKNYIKSTDLSTHTGDSTIHITDTDRTNWNDAYTNKHSHSNKSVLDEITSTKVANWDSVYNDWTKVFTINTYGDLKIKVNVIGEKEISAYGAGTSSGGNSGVDIVDALTSTRTDAALSANQGKILKGLIESIDTSGYFPLSGGTITGDRNTITTTIKDGDYKITLGEFTGSWARGIEYLKSDGTCMGYIGAFGTNNGTLDYLYFGKNYSDVWLKVNASTLTYKNNTIYHSGNLNPSNYITKDILNVGTDYGGTYIEGKNDKGLRIQYYKTSTTFDQLFMQNGVLKFNNNTVYHSGNLSKLSHLTDDIVSGKYLPITGGTLSSQNSCPLYVDTTHTTQSCFVLKHNGVNKGQLGYVNGVGVYIYNYENYNHLGINTSGNAFFGTSSVEGNANHHLLWHTGNLNSFWGQTPINGIVSGDMTGVTSIKWTNGGYIWNNERGTHLNPVGGGENIFDIDTNGYVGLGTNSPQCKLHIKGTTWMEGQVIISDTVSPTTPVNLGTTTYPFGSIYTNTGITIKDTGSSAILHYKGNNRVFALGSGSSDSTQGTEYGILQLYHNGSELVRLYANSTSDSWINAGNVGIGTSSPSYKLDVNGSSNVNGVLYFNGSSYIGKGSPSSNDLSIYTNNVLRIYSTYNTYPSYIYYYGADSNSAKLELKGRAQTEITNANGNTQLHISNSYTILGYSNPQTGLDTYIDGTNTHIRYGVNHKYTSTFGSNGIVNIGGSLVASGEVTAHSDRRLKTNIKPLKVRGELNPVTYTKDGKESIGFIADEVKEVYPELVITDDSTEEKYLSLNYAQLTAVLYAEIKELKERITQLENK